MKFPKHLAGRLDITPTGKNLYVTYEIAIGIVKEPINQSLLIYIKKCIGYFALSFRIPNTFLPMNAPLVVNLYAISIKPISSQP
ncbi:hypothetical protein FXW24_04175 [Candidatus Liberibacter asiaticus]|nr:hypothetical protein FXW32_04160 [Candidatus Liberibacter asiaticus]KAE9517282.1 hypothetical protein FXW24_04175 [Candidatus Liberibacter asiaticus]KAE9519348.1 hypothetical protein FXW29_04180 [Candidatus Liberibacter asiaticus]